MHDPVILPSARRDGIEDDDILHAYWHPIRLVYEDEVLMLVGGDRTGRLLEVGVTEQPDGTDVVIHAMAVRSKYMD